MIGLVERVQDIGGAPEVEEPCDDDAAPPWQRYQREQRKYCRSDVPVRGGMREGGRQLGRHDAWDQECQSDEAEAVQDENRPQCVGPWQEAEIRPEVSFRNDPPR